MLRKTILPALADGNVILNAFVLALCHANQSNQNIKRIILLELLGCRQEAELNNLLSGSLLRCQKTLAPVLRRYIPTLLKNLPRFEFKRIAAELYTVFEEGFIQYCSHHLKLYGTAIPTRSRGNNLYVTSDASFNYYLKLFNKLPFIQEAYETHAKKLYNHELGVVIKTIWNENWNALIRQYWQLIGDRNIPIGPIELQLLKRKIFEVNVDLVIKHQDDISDEDQLVIEFSDDNRWWFRSNLSHQQNNYITIQSNEMEKYYIKAIKFCYRFLDKIFYDDIFNKNYVPFNIRNIFFNEFRKRFRDEQSKLYGWRGLRNWILSRDIEIQKKNLGEYFSHRTPEFWDIMNILEEIGIYSSQQIRQDYQTNSISLTLKLEKEKRDLRKFINHTSIIKYSHKLFYKSLRLDDKDGKIFKKTLENFDTTHIDIPVANHF